MQVTVMANKYIKQRGYTGAILKLPASIAEIEDALARAFVPPEGCVTLTHYEGWPQILRRALESCREKTLEEVNHLAYRVGRMDEIQLDTFEGAIRLCQETGNKINVKKLINICYNLDSFVFQPDILNDEMLGELCLMGELLDAIRQASDEVLEMLDEEKVGQALRKSDKGVFTDKGYIFLGSEAWIDAYDGTHLPDQPVIHDGVISLRLHVPDNNSVQNKDVWLELPAGETELQQIMEQLEVPSFESCTIAEVKSIVPSLKLQMTSDGDINKLNILARSIQMFPDKETLTKYKAVLEYESCNDLDLVLDIAFNLDCYDFDPSVITLECYAEYVFQKADIDTDDPAFAWFDFMGYAERCLQTAGAAMTPYGIISRNEQNFVQEYTRPKPDMMLQ